MRYLSFDGVDDWLQAPASSSISESKIVLDIQVDSDTVNRRIINDAGNFNVNINANGTIDINTTKIKSVTVDGKAMVDKVDIFPLGKRITVEITYIDGNIGNWPHFIFCNYNGAGGYTKGRIYSVGFYNSSGAITAFYEMSTETVNDQVTNRNGKLTGGTWIDDGVKTLFLDMDGVDDRITTPTFTWDRVVFDVYIDSTKNAENLRYLIQPVTGVSPIVRLSANSTTLTVLNHNSVSGAVVGERTTLTVTSDTPVTVPSRICARSDGGLGFMGAKIYSIRYYNGGALVAHYDMTKGTTQDQSGNGYHATLVSGKWVEDTQVIHDGQATLTGNGTLLADGVIEKPVSKKYLSMDGVDDYLQTPSVTVDRVLFEMNIDETQPTSTFYYFLDWRPSNTQWAYGHVSNVPNAGWGGDSANLKSVIVNGTTTTGKSTFNVPRGVPLTFEINMVNALTGAIQFFRKNDSTFYIKSKVYRIRGYSKENLVFDYDMSTGTINDISGNGNNATLYGGTWMEDGTGGTPTTHDGQATLIGLGSLQQAGQRIQNSTTPILGKGLLNSYGIIIKDSSTFFNGQGIINVDSSIINNARMDLIGLGKLITKADGATIVIGSSNLIGKSKLDIHVQTEQYAASNLIGLSKFNTNGLIEKLSSINLSGLGTLYSAGQIIKNGESTLFGKGILNTEIDDVRVITANVHLKGAGNIIVDSFKIAYSNIDLIGGSVLNGVGERTALGEINLKSQGILSTDGYKIVLANPSLIGLGLLGIINSEPIISTIKLNGNVQLNVQLNGQRILNVNLKGLIK